ncbi:putative monosaccharide transporter [Meira miltonrushii]|uniref:Putative monosaccharide transporter n=1 Tax=Meira miltonrushii TaxID=1280837 RepID=A0A316VLS0_9BASI|nr:putative monosaccharide transporter [Meira miltonrushii]PWN38467.1 putative monosaccharide transporter [Meira miltonrushii]
MPTLPSGGIGKARSLPAPKPRTFREALPALIVAAFVAWGGILFGYDTGVISGIIEMENFKEQFGTKDNPPQPGWSLSTSHRSLVVSILSAGTFLGAMSSSSMADFLGRRRGLQFAIIIFTLGVIIQCVSKAVPLFAFGRFVAGLGVGAISCIVPLYQSEISPEWIRGALVTCYQWMITIGLLIASIVDNSTQHRPNQSSYLIPIAMQFIFALIIFVGLFILPESPRWFIKRGQRELAANSLARLNSCLPDSEYVTAEINCIQASLDLELRLGNGGYKEIFEMGERKIFTRVAVGAISQALQQLTGINFIFYYGVTFFKSTGAKNPFIFSIISNVVNVCSTVPGMWMMERVGRRPLFIYGAVWMFVSQLIVAAVGTAEPISNRPAQAAAVAFVCIYIAGFAATWGPATWVYTGETYPLSVRAKGISISTGSQWIWNFGIGYATPYLVDQGPGKAGLGPHVFFIWAGCCLLCILFAYLCINETSGLTLEEVDELVATVSPRNSKALNKELKKRRTQSISTGDSIPDAEMHNGMEEEKGSPVEEKFSPDEEKVVM